MKLNKSMLLLILLGGFLYTAFTAVRFGFRFQEVAWIFWLGSLISVPLLFASHLAEYFLSMLPQVRLEQAQKKQKPQKRPDQTLFHSPVVYTIAMTFFSGIGVYMTLFLGVFLAIIVPMSPGGEYFSVEGYSKNFGWDAGIFLLSKYWVLLPGFLCLLSSIFLKTQADRLRGSALVSFGWLVLLAAGIGFLMGLVLKNSSLMVPQVQVAQLLVFCFTVFLPWPLILGKDLRSKRYNKEPELAVPVKIPVEYTYKPKDVTFWGWFIMAFGLFILVVFLGASRLILTADYSLGARLAIGGFILLITFAVSGAFFFAGMNMLFGVKKFSITSAAVKYSEKGFIVFFPVVRSFTVSINEFDRVEQGVDVWSSSDEPTYFIYKVVLKHQKNPKRDVTLYRAYHPDDYENIAQQWAQLLNLRSTKSENDI